MLRAFAPGHRLTQGTPITFPSTRCGKTLPVIVAASTVAVVAIVVAILETGEGGPSA
jgi:hypothetical protein